MHTLWCLLQDPFIHMRMKLNTNVLQCLLSNILKRQEKLGGERVPVFLVLHAAVVFTDHMHVHLSHARNCMEPNCDIRHFPFFFAEFGYCSIVHFVQEWDMFFVNIGNAVHASAGHHQPMRTSLQNTSTKLKKTLIYLWISIVDHDHLIVKVPHHSFRLSIRMFTVRPQCILPGRASIFLSGGHWFWRVFCGADLRVAVA